MKPLEITEFFSQTHDTAKGLVHEQLKITNISSEYINNLKLIIEDEGHILHEQEITRERGSLSFAPTTTCLELGNLAPEESALFEYTYSATSLPSFFAHHISLTYSNADEVFFPEKKVVEFLPHSTTK